MAQKEYDIFISYRRVGGADKARILKTELEARGYKVFLDYDELKDGVFDKRIMDAIDSSPIFMFLLTPNSLERCINEDDWVRREIEYAVDNRKHFIPINPDCTFMSLPDNLSDKIKEGLGQHQFTDVMFGQLFNASINELIKDRIRPVLTEWGRVNAASSRGAIVRIEADLDCRILRFGKEIGLAQSGDIAEIKLPKGKHKLQFVGLENSADSYECLLSVEDLEYEDYIEVKLLDKYNACRAKEEAERKAREEAERQVYLLGLPDDEFKCFKENDKYGFKVASTGEIIIPLIYDDAWGFSEGLAKVKLNGKWGFIDKTGKEVIPLKYDGADDFSEGLASVKLNDKYGFIDKTGKEVIPLKYDYADNFREGLASVKLNGKWGFIDKTGKEVISLKYDGAWYFSEGLARVELNDKYGFIDKTGKVVIPLKYDYARNFFNGKAEVYLNDERFYIDKNGNRIE